MGYDVFEIFSYCEKLKCDLQDKYKQNTLSIESSYNRQLKNKNRPYSVYDLEYNRKVRTTLC